MNDILDDLKRYKADAMRGQDAGRQIVYTRAIDEIERLRKIEDAAKYVLKTFKKDESDGYRSRDRQFAIDILGKPFTPEQHVKRR